MDVGFVKLSSHCYLETGSSRWVLISAVTIINKYVLDISHNRTILLTLNLLTTTIVAPPSNASKWQMGFNSAFKGLISGTPWYQLHVSATILAIVRLYSIIVAETCS